MGHPLQFLYIVLYIIMLYTLYMNDPLAIFKALDAELSRAKQKRELVICGGAALIALGIVSRETRDVDVLIPELDALLEEAAKKIAPSFQLKKGWLNNGPRDLIKDLPKNWQTDCTKVFEGKSLRVLSIGRADLIRSKLYAACDRPEHLSDLIALKPTQSELAEAETWTLERDASDIWPQIVSECAATLRRKLGYGTK